MLNLIISFFTGFDPSVSLAMAWWMAIPAVVALAGGVAGGIAGSGNEAEDAAQEGLQQWLDLNVPDPEDQKIYLQDLKQQGILTPKMEQNIIQEDSEMQGISLDPALRQAQMGALGELQNIGQSGGMRLQDKASMDQIMNQIAADEQGKRGAIEQGMHRRGMGGSGMELASKLMNQQNAAQMASQQGLQTTATAQQRALDAIMRGGQLGGSIRGQDFSEAAQKASAQDMINKFNTGNIQDIQQRNVASGNIAAEKNLGESQRIADTNVGQVNYREQYNKELEQTQYENQLAKTAGTAGAYQTEAQRIAEEKQKNADRWANVATGAGKSTASMFSGGK